MFEVQNLIYIYMILCVAMIVFNWFYMIHNTRTDKKMEKRDKQLIKKIDVQIALIKGKEHVSVKHKKYLEAKLVKVTNLYIFEETLNFHEKEYVNEYIEEIKMIFIKLCKIYTKKPAIEKAYFTYILGKFEIGNKLESEGVSAFLFDMLNEESIYCIDNAMSTICKIGNIRNIIKATKIIDKKSNYQNIEIIVKNLQNYKKDNQELSKKLWENFEGYSLKLKVVTINYISANANEYWNKIMYEKLLDTKEKIEIKIAIIKYFSKNYYENVKKELFNILKLKGIKNTEYIITAIKALKIYPGTDTILELKQILQRNQWNIQTAASETLNYLGVNYLQLADIYNGENQKARRILKYVTYRQKRKGA